MSAHVTLTEPGNDCLSIELRQRSGEVVRFIGFVLIVVGGLAALIPNAREEPAFLFALLGAACLWAIIATSAREIYTIDTKQGVIHVMTDGLFGRRLRQIPIASVHVVRMAVSGPDDNRRLVELVAHDGTVCLRIPRRLTTLSTRNQLDIAYTLGERLAVPVRGEAAV